MKPLIASAAPLLPSSPSPSPSPSPSSPPPAKTATNAKTATKAKAKANTKAKAGRKAGAPATKTAKCRSCGRDFQTPTLAVRFCSDRCRERGYGRQYRRTRLPLPGAETRGAAGAGADPGADTIRCRVCSREFAAGEGNARHRVYCSDGCRAVSARAYIREYMRRYLADPERREAIAARRRAANAARRRAAAAARGAIRARCACCGGEFSTAGRPVRYCSDRCRSDDRSHRSPASKRRRRERRLAARGPAKCRICAREFEPGHGNGRLMAYCSPACQADGLLASRRESKRRRSARMRAASGPGTAGGARARGGGPPDAGAGA